MPDAVMETNPLLALPATPGNHFRILFYEAVLVLMDRLNDDFESQEDCSRRFPFIASYCSELAAWGLDGMDVTQALEAWRTWCEQWEQDTQGCDLPVLNVRSAALLDRESLLLIMLTGLVEEDARFGQIFEHWQSAQRPTLGMLHELRSSSGSPARERLRRLIDIGIIQAMNPQTPRMEWILQVPCFLWDIIRGEKPLQPTSWARYVPREDLPNLNAVLLPEAHSALPTVWNGAVKSIVVRGFEHNGRRTLLGALARQAGRGVLLITETGAATTAGGLLAVLMSAMPVVVVDAAPGETITLPEWPLEVATTGIVLSRTGNITGPLAEGALQVHLPMPARAVRRQLWERLLPAQDAAEAAQMRLTTGNIHRAARNAKSVAVSNGRRIPAAADIRQGSKQLRSEALDLLATRLEPARGWSDIGLPAETFEQLQRLESRCRHREDVAQLIGRGVSNCGVRAMFSGPSGTGKTLAARVLAALLDRDLYRLDLAHIVNKYIGETEKSLNRALTRAEQLDVILLLDEGDSLLAQRTQVQNSTDRYANLETNFLLQRLESFEGIVLITTNAPENIDTAFLRRMDHVIRFRAPEAADRLAIWKIHLPPDHRIGNPTLHEVAVKCALTGGQIRNIAIDCGLTSLETSQPVSERDLLDSLAREYRKSASLCPMKV